MLSKKLHSTRGATMLLALLFLLVSLSVGAVVLTAASAAAGGTARHRAQQQDYLAVASAAKLLSQEVQAITFTDSYEKEITETYYPDQVNGAGEIVRAAYTQVSDPDYSMGGKNLDGSSLFPRNGAVEDALDAIYRSAIPVAGLRGPVPGEQVFPLSVADVDGALPAVSGSLFLSDGYDLTLTLWAGDDASNMMTLRFPGLPDAQSDTETWESGNDTVYTTTCTTTVTWLSPVITKGGRP